VGTQEQVLTGSLAELGTKYGSDKPVQYAPFYDLLLLSRKESVRSVFEIGIFKGGSLRMWRDYFSNAEVYGMDINPDAIFSEERIDTVCGDQASPAVIRKAAERWGPFDLIIEDGSHKPDHQVMNAEMLMPYLNPGGLYIIEDVNPPVSEVSSRLPFEHTIVEHLPLGASRSAYYLGDRCVAAGRCILIQKEKA
jgi:predicted O-methyltransferase YrrM